MMVTDRTVYIDKDIKETQKPPNNQETKKLNSTEKYFYYFSSLNI